MIFNLIFRQTGQGTTPQAESLARNVEMRLNELLATVNQAINRVEKSGIQQPAPTVVGRLEQARRWLEQPGKNLDLQSFSRDFSVTNSSSNLS